jgi:hypothetical protein
VRALFERENLNNDVQRGRAVTQGLPATDRVPSKARTGRPRVAHRGDLAT